MSTVRLTTRPSLTELIVVVAGLTTQPAGPVPVNWPVMWDAARPVRVVVRWTVAPGATELWSADAIRETFVLTGLIGTAVTTCLPAATPLTPTYPPCRVAVPRLPSHTVRPSTVTFTVSPKVGTCTEPVEPLGAVSWSENPDLVCCQAATRSPRGVGMVPSAQASEPGVGRAVQVA